MKTIFAAALVAGTMMGFGIANAAPIAPAVPTVQGDIIQVAGGCGRGFHRGPRGGCRVNRGRVVVVPPRASGAPLPARHVLAPRSLLALSRIKPFQKAKPRIVRGFVVMTGWTLPVHRQDDALAGSSSARIRISRERFTSGQSRSKSAISRFISAPATALSSDARSSN